MPKLPRWCSGKESTCQNRRHRRCAFDPWVQKILWRRKWQPTPVFLPGKFHGQRSLAGYSPQGGKELHMTEHSTHAHHAQSKDDPCGLCRNITGLTSLVEINNLGTSLVVQWLRIHLPTQGTQVQSLVQEDPTCIGATKPMLHKC